MRIKFLPFLLILCLLAVGCATTVDNSSDMPSASEPDVSENSPEPDVSQAPEEPKWDTTPRELEHTVSGLWNYFTNIRMPSDSDSDVTTLIATSEEEMKEIIGAMEYDYSYEKFIEEYGEGFFDENALILSECISGTGSTIFKHEGVRIDEKGISVTISKKTPMWCTDDMQTRVLTTAVKKSDIGGCIAVKTVMENHVYPVSGKVGEYDETPRDIEFTPYVFNYKVSNYSLKAVPEFAKSKLKAYVYGDIYIRPYYGELEDYGKSGDNLDKYCKKGKAHFEDKAIIAVYVASTDGRSNFEISSLRADEKGITMTVKHTLSDVAETDEVYSVLVAEVEKELLAGCELFNVVLDESEAPFTLPDGLFSDDTKEKRPYKPDDGRDFEITVIDKLTKEPIKGATVSVYDPYGMYESVDYITDENGKVTVTVGLYDIQHHNVRIKAYIEEYFSYSDICPEETRDSYTAMLHKYLSDYE